MIKLRNFLLISIYIHLLAMEETEKEFGNLPAELKAKTMLFIANGLSEKNDLNTTMKEFKEKIKSDHTMVEILEGNKELSLLFTEKLLRALHKKFIPTVGWKAAIFCLVGALDNNAGWQILKKDYEKNKKLFFYLFTQNFTADRIIYMVSSGCFVNLMKVLEKIFTQEDKVKFFLTHDFGVNHTVLTRYLSLVMPPNFQTRHVKFIELIIDMATKNLTPPEKKQFLNKSVIFAPRQRGITALQYLKDSLEELKYDLRSPSSDLVDSYKKAIDLLEKQQ